MSENAVANAVSASMDASVHLHGAIAARLQIGGCAVIDETMARNRRVGALAVACGGGRAVRVAAAAGRSMEAPSVALAPV